MLLNPPPNCRVRVLSLCDEGARGLIAAEAAVHLEEMTGLRHDLPRRVASIDDAGAPAVVLEVDAALGREAFVCAARDGLVRIRGSDERGLFYGLMAFFEALGFRWFAPGAEGTVIPQLERVELPDGWQISGKPAFRWRGYHICGTGHTRDRAPMGHFDHDTALWMARNRMNFKPIHNEQVDDVNPLLSELLLSPLAFGHSYNQWIPPSEFAARPEFFPLIAGRRQPDGQRCLSNSNLRRQWVERIVAYLDAHPPLSQVSLAPNDAYKWCQCSACAAMDSPQDRARDELNRRNHLFSAAIAREVGARRPGRSVSTISYCNYLDPVDDVPREEALAVSMCITRAQNRALDDAQSPSNRIYLDRTERWLEKAGQVFWSFYFLSYGGTFPRPYEAQTLRTLRLLAEKGVAGIKSEVSPGEYDVWRSAIFFMYLAARGMYDTSLDAEALQEDFCSKFYGPAAAPCLRYYRLHSEVIRRFPDELTQMDADLVPKLYTEADLALMRGSLDDAVRALDGADPVYRRRLDLLLRQGKEIEDTRREMDACAREAAPLTAAHRMRPPDFDDFDSLVWTPQRMRKNRLPYATPSRFAATWTDEALFICFRLGEPDMRQVFEGHRQVPDARVWGQSNVDCFFCPVPESGVYFQVAVNISGMVYGARARGREWDSAYALDPEARVRGMDGHWELVLGLRFDRLQMPRPRAGDRLRLAINRGQLCIGPTILGGWPNGGSWHRIETMGELEFTT